MFDLATNFNYSSESQRNVGFKETFTTHYLITALHKGIDGGGKMQYFFIFVVLFIYILNNIPFKFDVFKRRLKEQYKLC